MRRPSNDTAALGWVKDSRNFGSASCHGAGRAPRSTLSSPETRPNARRNAASIDCRAASLPTTPS